MEKNRKWTAPKDDFIDEHGESFTCKELSMILGVSLKDIYNRKYLLKHRIIKRLRPYAA